MDYKIVWLDEALDDLRKLVEDISRDNPVAAGRLGEAILEQVQLLAKFPRLGHVFAKLGREDVRERPVRPYRIFYQVQDSERCVYILCLWHGARQEPTILPR